MPQSKRRASRNKRNRNPENDIPVSNRRLRVHLTLKPAILAYASQYSKMLFDGNLSEAMEDIIVQVAGPEYLKLAYSIQRLRKEKK